MKPALLIIDRLGLIGEPLSLKLSKEFFVVFVSNKDLDSETENKNILQIPFSKKFPVIPDEKYSHLVFIDENIQDLEILPKVINKVKDVNADFIFAQGLSSSEEYAVNNIMRLYPSAKIVLFGDIFDNKLISREENHNLVINKFIYQAQKFGKMQVLGEGLRGAYPVFLQDVVDGLIELVFKIHKSNNSLFYLFPQHPSTELSLAHMIQKINPEIALDFTKKDPRLKKIAYPLGGENLLADKYPLAQKIRSIDIRKKVKPHEQGVSGNAKKPTGFILFTVWILIFLFFSPLIFTLFFSLLGSGAFKYAQGKIEEKNIIAAEKSAHLSQAFFSLAKQTFSVFSLQAKFIGRESNLQGFSESISSGHKVAEVLSQALSSETYFSKIISGKSENPKEDFTKAENYLKNSLINLDKIEAEGKISAPILQNIKSLNPLIKLLSNTLEIMPNIFGMETPKTYLILFQDNLRLRPGGGLINSYGILKFNLGKITEFSIHDTSGADEQLRGHVEPPFAIRRYLPSTHWYMKDSNFDVDFAKDALSAANFLNIETGQQADGIIGINAAAYKAIMAKIKTGKISYLIILQEISDALARKDLLFFSQDSQNIFIVNGWSSSLWDERPNSAGPINDFIGINEASLGTTEINKYILRQVLQKVTLENSGNISEELTINYKNSALSGKDYLNYLRIILPQNTELSEISINDSVQNIVNAITDPSVYEAKNFKAPQGLEIEKTSEENKTIFGFLVKIPAGEIVKIKLKYVLAQNIAGLNTFTYNLKFFKQPGIDSINYSLKVIKNSDMRAFSEKITGDKNFPIDFAKNK